ncbi:MAG: M28 family peptidase [Flavisolibacter sp.]
MKKIFLSFALAANIIACAQKANEVINVKEVERIETVLASDEMRGRKAGTPDIDKAADFIAGEFKKAGLQPLQGNSYLQEFTMVRPKFLSVKGEIDDQELNSRNIIVVTMQPEIKVDEKSGYDLQYVKAGENFRSRVEQIMSAKKNAVVFVDSSFSKNFPRLAGFKRPGFKADADAAANMVFILGNYQPKEFKIKAEHNIEEIKFANVVGVLPGNSKKNEYVIFSGHYDHLGIGKPVAGDSIYNGANDDAAGTTAVIMLANYFKQSNNNERSLVFAAFTAEEIGGFGSQYFSKQFDPAQVMAMFNIEMIGTESKWGKNSAYITGFEKTNMGEILQQNLKGTSFTFYPDPYTEQNLFYRSDNATLARLGVPAHTISTSKMDNEPNYHQASDEVKTLDMENMAQIIKAVAESSKTIVSGKDTPTRVKTEELK